MGLQIGTTALPGQFNFQVPDWQSDTLRIGQRFVQS